jgi:hypothetical protein
MHRRHFLALLAAAGALSAGPAFAHDGDEIIPGLDDALAAGSPILIHIMAGSLSAPLALIAQLRVVEGLTHIR